MPVYEYTALDKEGRQISGLIDAESPAAARQKIRGQDQYPIGLTGANQAAFSLKRLMRSGPAFRQKQRKHPYPCGYRQRPKVGSYLVKIRLPR